VPVYNEEKTLDEIIRRVQAVDLEKEIICVDDASRDASWSILERLSTHAFEHPDLQARGESG
jgi:glycosyltransferase involved in cell wall biosynthesis